MQIKHFTKASSVKNALLLPFRSLINGGITVLLLSILLLSSATYAQSPGTAPVLVPAGGFGIEGDLQANTPTAGIGDWLKGSAGSGGYVLDSAGNPLNPGTTFHLVDSYGSNDNSFSGGKANDDPNVSWAWSTGAPNSKTNINNVLIHFSFDAKGHQWVIIAADRESNSGEAYMDFEFLQNTLTVDTNSTRTAGGFVSAGPNGGRTVGDFNFTFSTGGNFSLETWQLSGSTYTYVTYPAPAGTVYAANNSAAVPVSFGAFGSTTYPAGVFIEGAIDITALLGSVNPCTNLGIKTIFVKSRTSASASASLEDMVIPIQVHLQFGVAQAGANQALCSQGASTLFTLAGSAIATPGDTVKTTTWSVKSGSATITNPSSLTSAVQVSSASATLLLTITTKLGCSVSDSVVLTVNPQPTATISGSSSICSGNPVTLTSSTGASSPTYLWSPGSATTSAITVSPAFNTTYSVTITDGTSGCSATSAGKAVSVSSTPSVTISAGSSTVFCMGNSVILTGNGASGYLWSTGVTTSSITVSTSGTYSVTGTSLGGCSATSAGIPVTANPNPQVSINPLSICEGQSGQICATSTGSSLSYVWNSQWEDGINNTSKCYTVIVPGDYSVMVTDGNGCFDSASVVVDIYSAEDLQVAESGPTTFCQGSSVTLTASGASSYVWNTGSTTAALTVSTGELYSVTGTNSSGCKISVLVNVTIIPSPGVTITPDGSTTFCEGDFVTLYAEGAGTYVWSNNDNGLFIDANASGTYSVVGTDGNGCTNSAGIVVTVNSPPTVTLSSFSPACLNAGVFDLNQGSPAGGIYSGDGVSANSFDPVAAGGVGSYTITYYYTNSNGCSNQASGTLTVTDVPDDARAITGTATGVCPNATETYSIASVNGATSYTWTAPAGASIISGQGSTSVSVNFGNSFDSGTLQVIAYNACGGSSPASVIIISTPPATPSFIYGNATPCKREYDLYWVDPVAGAGTYTWSVPPGSRIIDGQGTDTIAVVAGNKNGDITVETTDACGNGATSSLTVYTIACRMDSIETAAANNDILMYVFPNPVHDVLNIMFISSNTNDYMLKIFDVTGRLVMNETKQAETGENLIQLNLSFAKGLYIVSLSSGEVNKQEKIIVE